MPKHLGIAFVVGTCLCLPTVHADEKDEAVKRGRLALETRAFTSAGWSFQAYENAWKYWGKKYTKKPENYKQAFMEHYGLHEPPYENGKYPMGLRVGQGLFTKGIASDCMICHGGSIMGKSYVGLGNTTIDMQALVEDMGKADGGSGKLPFAFSNVRGTTEAAGFAVFLMSFRQPDLNIRLIRHPWKVPDDICEDPPAWWLLNKKKTMYQTGSNDARSVRSIMQFMLGSSNGPEKFAKEEATFAGIQAYIKSIEAPPYPFPIDKKLAQKGKVVFEKTCATCHGTYGKDWTYPNKIIPIDVIGTDRNRYEGLSAEWGDYYNKSWFAQEKGANGKGYPTKKGPGYQAPPLDGVWATAPYLHNASVPTLYHLLKSSTRPTIFTRSYRTDESAYDKKRVGWKVQNVSEEDLEGLSPYELRKIYNTTLSGRGNGGHLFGDDLSEDDRWAVIEYLKTL